jgi:hypothetical protein
MGTSSSFRAPAQPRWSAFIAALTSQAPIDRVRSELFNAGSEWQAELAAPAIARFAEAIVRLHAELPDRLAQTERADVALGALIAEARDASMQAGFSAASALAERAFARLLISTVQGVAHAPEAAGARWEAARGSASELVGRYIGELFAQYARHVTDREAGRLAVQSFGAEASARLSDRVAEQATSIAVGVATDVLQGRADISSVWADVISRIFELGRRLPRGDA